MNDKEHDIYKGKTSKQNYSELASRRKERFPEDDILEEGISTVRVLSIILLFIASVLVSIYGSKPVKKWPWISILISLCFICVLWAKVLSSLLQLINPG